MIIDSQEVLNRFIKFLEEDHLEGYIKIVEKLRDKLIRY